MSRITDWLAVSRPIIQAPMAGVQGSELTLAVCAAGGLGSLPCAMLTPEQLQQALVQIRESTTQPYNVNFFCHTQPAPDAATEARWQARLQPYYQMLGLSQDRIVAGAGRRPFDAETLALLDDFRPPVVSFHFGLPDESLLETLRSWGTKILSSATTLEEALWLQARGVDAVIAQGLEAGGHRGMFLTDDMTTQTGLFALLPQLVDRLSVPVIAAGGIASPAGVQAAFALGASAVQVGTAYLLCPEAKTSALHRQALQSPEAVHTALTNLFSGRPARGIVNRVMRELGPICVDAPAFPLATAAIAPLRAEAEARGIADFSPLWAGQNTSGCQAIPAAELTRWLMSATS
ncbi:nitronate monooxygenase [Nitrincola lacisaponensis]|uniref:NAD(P)H-dependent flavin oxidoreductase n=1 Tax=Nitrincola lacisaponensis TaxID=267850 RepID=UPI0012690855